MRLHIRFCLIVLCMFSLSGLLHAEGISDVECTSSGIWCASSSGLYCFDFTEDTVSRHTPVDFGGLYKGVGYITKAPDNSLWITTCEDFILRYDGEAWSAHGPDYVGLSEEIPIQKIAFHNDIIWFNSRHAVFEYKDSVLTEYTNYIWGGSSDIPIHDFTFDRNGQGWAVGTEGLTKIDVENNTMVWDDRFHGFGYKLLIDKNDVFWIGAVPFYRQDEELGGLVVIDGESVSSYTTDNSDIPSNTVVDLAFDSSGMLWLCLSTGVASFDGEKWIVYDSDDFWALNDVILSIAIDDNDTKWIGTKYNGLLRYDGETWSQFNLQEGEINAGIEEPSDTPSSIDLLPVYPNPFNPETTISYVLPKAGKVTLTVHSVTGQQVAVLVDGYMDAGSHSVVFNGEGLASGVYFCRLSINGRAVTQKLTLVR